MGMLRTTRVGSRYATLAAGILLIVLGGIVKFDMLLVMVPQPVVSAAATLLFGVVFMHGVRMLAMVEWDERASSLRDWRCWWGSAECSLRRRRCGDAIAGAAVHSAAGDFGRADAGGVARAAL